MGLFSRAPARSKRPDGRARKYNAAMQRRPQRLRFFLVALALAPAGGGCGGGGEDATITADGSSTARPFVAAAAESFRAEENADVDVVVSITGDIVGEAGTGGGFERFCRGETDLSNASRPIHEEERAACAEDGVEFLEFRVANDALTNVVNPENAWATCLTVGQLKAIWEPGSTIRSWRQVDRSFPDVPLRLFGPGTDSGTFDYFTERIVGTEGASRTDYSRSEQDNVIVQHVASERGGLGYLGFSYFEENQDRLQALAVDAGQGCVAPSAQATQARAYPLARPLFVYVKESSFDDDHVRRFVKFMLDNGRTIAEAAGFVPLNDVQRAEEQAKYEEAAE
jgi:phosphate transport system substrate-binding protein